jgi:hypothetical protein
VGLLTLEERRHQADMVQTYKIVTGKDMVKSETWFQSVAVTGRATRSADDPLNIPSSLKQAETVRAFKNGYRDYSDYRAMAEGTAR